MHYQRCSLESTLAVFQKSNIYHNENDIQHIQSITTITPDQSHYNHSK